VIPNELYDHAFSLLEVAQGLRAAAGFLALCSRTRRLARCIEASLQELRDAVPKLRDTALTPADAEPDHGSNPAQRVQIRANFALLARDLSNSRTSCAAVRRLVGPALAKRWT
jgi:hypothetical protein